MYPYRIRINDPELINIFKNISRHRAININDSNMAKRIGHKVPRTIKNDGFRVKDGIVAITNPKITLDFEPAYGKRKGYDFIFKSLF